jgi:hypothetical protein
MDAPPPEDPDMLLTTFDATFDKLDEPDEPPDNPYTDDNAL